MREKVLLIFVPLLVLTIIFFSASAIRHMAVTADEPILFTDYQAHDMVAPIPKEIVRPTPNPVIDVHQDLIETINDVPISYTHMEFEYIGQHFITAYCPEECGYNGSNFPKGWITATGTICHREEEWWNPSTCGIATDYHHYGELFYIDGKVYVAEDTGLISGAWIDLFMPDYETMSSFGSHWTEVYSVEYVTTEPVKGKHFNINDYL